MKLNNLKAIVRSLENRLRKIIDRCTNVANKDWANYGGRGITVWDGWLDPVDGKTAFVEYVMALPLPQNVTLEAAISGPRSRQLTIDRVNNDGHYEPGNLRLASPVVQSGNKRNTARVDGLPRSQLARAMGVDPRTAAKRQREGYSGAEAVSLPCGGRTAEARRMRDRMILAMIEAGVLHVDDVGFVLVKDADGWHLPPLGSSGERYIGVSITIPPAFISRYQSEDGAGPVSCRSMFQHARIVALFHHPLPDDGLYYEVDHINMNTRDDRPENLRWRRPDDHRSDAHTGRAQTTATAPDYADYTRQQTALVACVLADRGAMAMTMPSEELGLPANLSVTDVDGLVAQVQVAPGYGDGLFGDPRYAALLPQILSAAGNEAVRDGGGVRLNILRNGRDTLMRLNVTDLRTTDKVYFGCPVCGRQRFAGRTEVRNRVRYPGTPCESCGALDRVCRKLAALIAPDPTTGIKRDPSRITAGSNRDAHFRCRVAGCPNIVRRRIKTQVRAKDLPTCEAHRRRGLNFG
ncbi:MAG: HNH endonuclease [Burkholderiales bacterium]